MALAAADLTQAASHDLCHMRSGIRRLGFQRSRTAQAEIDHGIGVI
jgi:hypothetical protein